MLASQRYDQNERAALPSAPRRRLSQLLRYQPLATVRMKNFALLINLDAFDCCARRIGLLQIGFHFWMRDAEHVVECYCGKTYPNSEVVDALFDYYQDQLAEEAQAALDIVMCQLQLHREHIEQLTLDGETAQQLYDAQQD